MTSSPAEPPVIRTQADLTAMWQDLLSPRAAEPLSLSLAFLDTAGTRPPALVCIDDVPPSPHPSDGDHLRGLVEEVRGQVECDTVVVALVRGGSPRVEPADRAWGRCLAEQVGLTRHWPAHLVTPDGARVLTADDLLGRAPAAGT